MAETAKRGEKENKGKMIGIICFVAIVVVLIVVAIVMLVRANSGISDSYFVSDDKKLVMTVDTEAMGIESSSENAPVKAHVVYPYEGETITGMTMYYEFTDGETAKTAYDEMMAEDSETYAEAKVEGKYVIMPAEESDYADMTVDDVKQQIEFMEMLYSDSSSEESSEESSDTETTE